MANRDEAFDNKIKTLVLDRPWDLISDYWLTSIPRIDPDLNVGFEALEEFGPLSDLVGAGPADVLRQEIPLVRQIVFREAVFLLHKAINVLSLAEMSANRGSPTWSLSTAYHSAFLGMRSLTRLFGVAHVTSGKNTWVIDIFPQWVKQSKRKSKDVNSQSDMLIFKVARMDQRHYWRLFQRLVCTTKFGDQGLKNLAADFWKIDEGDFSEQRHALIYENNSWYFDDLYKDDIRAGFGIRTSNLSIKDDRGTEDFTLVLAYSMVEFGIRLLRSLREKANILAESLEVIENSVTNIRHPMYNASRDSCFVASPE